MDCWQFAVSGEVYGVIFNKEMLIAFPVYFIYASYISLCISEAYLQDA